MDVIDGGLQDACLGRAGLPELLGPEAAAAASGRMQLHARSIEIGRGCRGPVVRAVAPAPPHMAAMLTALGWQQQESIASVG